MKVLITGGARSGKSRHAQALAERQGPQRTYLATAEALDDDMAARIARHREQRGAGWTTIEAPLRPDEHLGSHVVLLDCLTLWVSNLFGARGVEADLSDDFARLVAALRAAPGDVVVVSNEVGLGLVPDNALARRYRDELGRLTQQVAEVCDQVLFMVAGLPLRVK